MAVERHTVTTYREHAAVHSAQPARGDFRGDGLIAETQLDEPGTGQDSVLASGKRVDTLIKPWFSTFLGHNPKKTEDLPSHPLIARRWLRIAGRWIVSTAACPPSPT